MIRRGRPDSKWNDDRPRQAYLLSLLGATDREIAGVMDVEINTFNLWKRTHPALLEMLNRGKIQADSEMAEALFRRGKGFSIVEERVFMHKGEIIRCNVLKYYPPDSWAANKWLAVRQRDKWSEVQRIESTQTNINITKIDLTGFSREELMLMQKMNLQQLTENAGSN